MVAVAFLNGLISSLSACVYPLIPITTALFGTKQARNWFESFFLSFIYVLGMAVTYVALGVSAALMGNVFGAWMASPTAIIVFSVIFFYLGFSFAGLLPLPLPNFADRLQIKQTSSLLYPFLLGVFSGFIAAPCTAPFFGATLTQIAATAASQDSIVPGVVQALAFSLGMGLPFLLIGGFALRLPKPGKWLVAVKYFGAIVLLTAGMHFLEDLFSPSPIDQSNWVVAVMGLIIAVLFFFLIEPFKDSTTKNLVKKIQTAVWVTIAAFGLFLATTPVAQALTATQTESTPVIKATWFSDIASAQKQAAETNGLILIDFWAEWCGACHEMEAKLFHTNEFQSLVTKNNLTLLRLDFTDPTPALEKLAKKYSIMGLPTLVLTDAKGEMLNSIIGFYSKKTSLHEIQYAISTSAQK